MTLWTDLLKSYTTGILLLQQTHYNNSNIQNCLLKQQHLNVLRWHYLQKVDRRESCDLATMIHFLVTCVQPEMLHISLHYEWIHLPPEYLTPLQIRLQITGELLIPIDYHELAWGVFLVWGRDKHFHRNWYVWLMALWSERCWSLKKICWIVNNCRRVNDHDQTEGEIICAGEVWL